MLKWNFLCFDLFPLPFVMLLSTTKKGLDLFSSFFHTLQGIYIKFPPSFSSLSLLSH